MIDIQLPKNFFSTASHLTIEGVNAPAKPLVLASLFRRMNKTLVVIVEHNIDVTRLVHELEIFAPTESAESRVLAFPSTGTFPFENQSPEHAIVFERLRTLNILAQGRKAIVITTAEALYGKIIPLELIKKNLLVIKKGTEISRHDLEQYLFKNGYRQTDLVEDRGSYSFRGDIFDVFPSNTPYPIRTEFWGDQIESIRMFKPETQRTIQLLDKFNILPSREIVLEEDIIDPALEKIQARGKQLRIKDSFITTLLNKVKAFRYIPGIENYAPYFYPLNTFFDYIPADSIILHRGEEELNRVIQTRENEIVLGEENANINFDIFPDRADLYLQQKDLLEKINAFSTISLKELKLSGGINGAAGGARTLTVKSIAVMISKNNIKDLAGKIKGWLQDDKGIIIYLSSKSQLERMYELLMHEGIGSKSFRQFPEDYFGEKFNGKVFLALGKIRHSFQLYSDKRIFLAEDDVFGKTVVRKRSEKKTQAFLDTLKYIKDGDYIVHADYGIGIYRGLASVSGFNSEFVLVEYKDRQKLYIPMENIGLLTRYVAPQDVPVEINKMGGVQWTKTKAKVKKEIEKIVEYLVELYAKRSLVKGFSFSEDGMPHEEFMDAFEYEETDDQLSAINDITADMEKPMPMDRLLCGDVGFGKTEVAMRAAFKAVVDKRQVTVLVPTTVLAYQHYQSFMARFNKFGIKVEMLNRLRSTAEQKQILEDLESGAIDIIVGTHRILSKDIKLKDHGLLIVDEEHRFGVSAKEKIKQVRSHVDVLTLTATPIPRTLQFSLLGIRDMSVIATPPKNRLPIKTYLRPFDEEVVEAAVRFELERGGQVFFIHNTIDSINSVAEMLQALVPEARIGVAHGRLAGDKLQEIMLEFVERKFDILVSTTIVESGIDIPTANTIIINNAHMFGMAQLYQLRGRVGRYEHRAFAYLLIPGEDAITDESKQRLVSLEEMTELGAGFQLAMKDLEIRGGGNLLGMKQSGKLLHVGFELYSHMIEEAMRNFRQEELEGPEEREIVIKVGVKGTIPKDYIEDDQHRLDMYKKIFTADSVDEVHGYSKEMADRFGKYPEDVKTLLVFGEVKALAKQLGCRSIELQDELELSLYEDTPIDQRKLYEFVGKNNKWVRFTGNEKLYFRLGEQNSLMDISKVLKRLMAVTVGD